MTPWVRTRALQGVGTVLDRFRCPVSHGSETVGVSDSTQGGTGSVRQCQSTVEGRDTKDRCRVEIMGVGGPSEPVQLGTHRRPVTMG